MLRIPVESNARRAASAWVEVDLGAITTGNLDMIRQYRAETNVVRRPPGDGFTLVGQHELLLPLLRMAILSKLEGGRVA